MQDKTIPQIFCESVKRYGEKAALVDEFTNREISYEQLKAEADQAGRALLELGIKSGDTVSIWAPNMAEWVIAALGAQSAGGVLVPLNTRFKGREAGYILEHSKARFLFCVRNFLDTDYLELLYEAFENSKADSGKAGKPLPISGLKNLEKVILLEIDTDAENNIQGNIDGNAKGGSEGSAEENDKDSATASNLEKESLEKESPAIMSWEDFFRLGDMSGDVSPAVKRRQKKNQKQLERRIQRGTAGELSDILFTSGTTGLPKGVMTTHSQSINGYISWSECVGLKEGDKYLIVNPFFHSFGYKAGWLASLMGGLTIYPKAVFDPAATMEAVQRFQITVLPGPPTLYQSILNHPDFEKYDMSSLRVAVTGAAAIPVELILEMRKKLSFENILTGYGLTESSGIATMCQVGDDPETIASTSGRAIPNVEVMVVDEGGKELLRGEPGEIWIRGYNITSGYLADPNSTSEAITPQGWLKTGDIGIMDSQGYVRITDRKKDMFIMGGFNVYPAEVENILQSHPAIAQSALVGIPDDKFGEVGAVFIILRTEYEGEKIKPEDIAGWCRENMANYKVPRHIEFVKDLPMNASGKVLKYELRKKFN